MIDTASKKVQINQIVRSQLPSFVSEDSPLFIEFLSEYYKAQEFQGGSIDIITNFNEYQKAETFSGEYALTGFTTTVGTVRSYDTTITVESTKGWPQEYGLLKIDDEIITYTGVTTNTFTGCIRGFSGVESLHKSNQPETLVFSQSESSQHISSSRVINLSNLFLQEFWKKTKTQFLPGFEDRTLTEKLDKANFLRQAKDFYASKGTDEAIKILFGALYGKNAEIIKPIEYLITPSDADYVVTVDVIAELISGNATSVVGQTLYQTSNLDVNASIFNIQNYQRNDRPYYLISLSQNSVNGNFKVTGASSLIESVSIGATVITVDSTLGFPDSGTMYVGTGQTVGIATYTSRSSTQFFGVTGITSAYDETQFVRSLDTVVSYENGDITKPVYFRLTSVVTGADLGEIGFLSANDTLKAKSLGNVSIPTNYRLNSWIHNLKTKSDVAQDIATNTSSVNIVTNEITTVTPHLLTLGDHVTLLDVSSNTPSNVSGTVNQIINTNQFKISITSGSLSTSIKYVVRKELTFASSNSTTFDVSKFVSNVQNTYTDRDEKYNYVASGSLPSYKIYATNRRKTFEFTAVSNNSITINNHGFYSGDLVRYSPVSAGTSAITGLSTGTTYAVTRIDDTTIKLSQSRFDASSNRFITLVGTGTTHELVPNALVGKNVQYQNFFRRFPITPSLKSVEYELKNEPVGMFVNGVEILSNRAGDDIFYGSLKNIVVDNGGSGYDIINPPNIHISDAVGSGATAYAIVENGSFNAIEVVSGGYDIKIVPSVTIAGGNGSGATASARLRSIRNKRTFNADIDVDTTNNKIVFSANHLFYNGDAVYYEKADNYASVGGLVDKSIYYVHKVNDNEIQLMETYANATIGSNAINLTSKSAGTNALTATTPRNVIDKIIVDNAGSGYSNRRALVESAVFPPTDFTTLSNIRSGINTANDYIFFKAHGFVDGELVEYRTSDTVIGGLSTTQNYYVSKIDDDKFNLISAGIGTTSSTADFNKRLYVNLTSIGVGTHTFKYPDISVSVNTISGTASTSISSPVLRPICVGEITQVQLTSIGSGYGVTDTFNVHRKPNVTVSNGSGALIDVVVTDGQISQAFVKISGSGYVTPPTLNVIGDGKYAKLVANLSNGTISSVSIVDSGKGYTQENTTVNVVTSGNGARFDAEVNKWQVDVVQRYKNSINENDDGIIVPSQSDNYGVKFSHAYLARQLRLVLGDNIEDNFSEKTTLTHSPIVGWAYDGCPIYGPYGYGSPTGGTVRRLTPSYTLSTKANRPTTSKYPLGFFINDWDYTADGDLDQYNGRFCKTPEFPDGVYAYFCTIEATDSSDSPFTNTREPLFPYVLNGYKNEVDSFNLDPSSIQTLPLVNDGSLTRNTYPYKFGFKSSAYDYLTTNNLDDTEIAVRNIIRTGIGSVSVVVPGENYKVNDSISFNNTNSGGSGASALVKTLVGKGISSLTYTETEVNNVTFTFDNQTVTGVASTAHGLSNNDLVIITGIGTGELKFIEGARTIAVSSVTARLDVGIGTSGATGITTTLVLANSGSRPNIFVDDVIGIGTERLRVLSINADKNEYRVRRVAGLLTSHEAGETVTVDQSRFSFTVGIKTNLSTPTNRKIVFNPQNSIGIGTTVVVQSVAGVGTTTIVRVKAFDGTILTDHQLPPSGSTADNLISISNHGLISGQKLVYNAGPTGIALTVSNNLNLNDSFNLVDGQTVYAVDRGDNLLGITTTKAGIGSTSTSLYFTPVQEQNGVEHFFETANLSYVGSVKRYDVNLRTVEDHTLKTGNTVAVHILPNTTKSVSFEYDTFARKTIIDPKYFGTSAVGVGTSLSTITITDHNYASGDKILYTSSNPITPLFTKGEYYVQKLDDNRFRLSTNYTDSIKFGGQFIGITSFGSGVHTISKINPHITARRGQTIGFAVSDVSIQDFKLEFFEDENFENKYEGFGISTEVTRTGTPGTPGALVNLKLSENVPTPLYYKLSPQNLDSISVTKRDATPDASVNNGSKIIILDSVYSGRHGITTTSNTNFRYQVTTEPESASYTSTSGITTFSYTTDSTDARGGINEIKVNFGGVNYIRNPGINTIKTVDGKNAILRLYDDTIGRPGLTEIIDVGFEYPSDNTIKPQVDIPTVVTITNNYVLNAVGVVTSGKNYIIAPDLTIPSRPDVTLVATLEGTSVGSVQVTNVGRGFNEVPNPPGIVPIRNTNGVGIVSASSNGDTNFLTITQPTNGWRSDGSDFPFAVGDKVFVEGVGLATALTSTGGYNSEDYGYTFFEVLTRNPSTAQITYSIAGIGTTGGTFNADDSAGRVIKQSDLPTFSAELNPEAFFLGEKVTYGSDGIGFVLDNDGYDPVTNTVRLRSLTATISPGDTIKGFLSGAEGTVANVETPNKFFDVGFGAKRAKGWQRDTGKLSDDFQKIEDNDYYQNFSYSIKSEVQEKEWKDAVESIVHPTGYKNFSDLIVISTSTAGVGRSNTLEMGAPTSDTTLQVNIDNIKSFYNRDDFDFAGEETLTNGLSKFITLQNKKISTFINVESNRVDLIDDIADQFTGIGTTTSAEVVGLTTFKLTRTNGSVVLFNKVFDGSDSNIISVGSSIIRINNHDFQTGERIKYDPGDVYGNNRVGIITTNKVLGGVSTSFMPAEVYVIKIDNNRFSLAGLNTAVTNNEPLLLRAVGSGTSHSFDVLNPDKRVVIDIDGIVQSPLFKRGIDVTLDEPIGVGSTTIKVTGITSITSNDLFNIDNEILQVGVVGFGSTNVLTVDRGLFGTVAVAHTVGAAVTVRGGNFHIVKDVLHFVSAPYGPTGVSTLQPGISTSSTFSGRVFGRKDPTTNFIFDDISDQFTGIGKTFTLLQDDQDVTGIVTTISGGGGTGEVINNGLILINNIVQRPIIDFTMDERTGSGIGASVFFTGTSETNLPRGGRVGDVTVGFGSGYQNLVAAAATAVINGSGSIESVVVTGGGSGYRSGPVDIQVLNPLGIGSTAVLSATVGSAGTITGITTTSGGSGYASTNPPIIIVGVPTAYSNMSFTGGQGSGFVADVTVGTGGSIIDFNITNRGIGYYNGDVLTVAGIPTDPNAGAGFSAFTFTVNSRIDDKFAGFSFGQLLPLDSFADKFDGGRRVFTLTRTVVTTEVINIDTNDTSIDVANNLLVFLNDVLQKPGENYIFSGGTQIEFTEAPKAGSKLQILFFRGSNDDVDSGTPFPTVKIGDKLTLQRNGNTAAQLSRRVTEITGVKKAETNLYGGAGINNSTAFTRRLSWEKQTSDLILNNQALPKSRTSLIAKVQPNTRIIQNVGVSSDVIFVENAFPLFSAYDNRTDRNTVLGGSIKIMKENNVDAADASATVSAGGTISALTITDPGAGYDTVPTVSFASTIPQVKEIGKVWTTSDSNTDIEYQNVDYTDIGIFVAVGSTSGINTSTDGITWSSSTATGFGTFFSVVGLATNIIAVGLGGTIAVSTDRGGSYTKSVIYSRSLNGFIYEFTDSTISQDLNDVATSSTKAVAVGAGGTILFSQDGPLGIGTGFIIANKYSVQDLYGVANNANTFIAVGNNGELLRSNGGEVWSGVTTTSITTRLNDIHHGNNAWIAVGAAGTIIRSTDDGLTWSVVSSGSTFNLNSVHYQNNVWVAVGQTGNVMNSFNGTHWYQRSVGVSTDFNGLAFGDNKLVTVGLSSNILYSEFATVSAAATATVSVAGTITSLNLSERGFGYDPNTPVEVLISVEPVVIETITSADCDGDWGTVIGIGTSSTGIGTDSPMVKFELDSDPFLDQAAFGNITKSGIVAGYYFVVHGSVVGNGLTSINVDSSVIGIGTTFIDNVFRADEVVTSSSGIVTVYSNVQSLAGLGTTSLSPRIGYYSWGRFYSFNRSVTDPKSFTINNQNGYTGLTTAPVVYRVNSVTENYNDFSETS